MNTSLQHSQTDGGPFKRAAIISAPPLLLLASGAALYRTILSTDFSFLPQSAADFNLIVLTIVLTTGLGIALWQTLWLLIALYARASDSITAANLVRNRGPKWINLLLASSLSLGTACGGYATEIQAAASTVSDTSNYQALEVLQTDPTTDLTLANNPSFRVSDLRWGAAPEISLGQTKSVEIVAAPELSTYTVQTGDSLWKIAKSHLATLGEAKSNHHVHQYVLEIYRENRAVIGVNPNLIIPGTQLALPTLKEAAK
ncbi:LysM peptidoglycan-binding domain-containing protein [Boudabousia marimammalium]|uniref:LysM domain-containing protein n=1 Tax=Boudabousia marimammalium TaxID=156892 RepID=A0A1Q5PRX6_9ACTO|nr:LysM domain-containing protein [Boudabousia marimammalium]OKL50195.1 hypothetical protein BM477_02030 [Boudabousia marimammalium]